MTLHQIISLSLVDPKKTSSVIVLVMVTWLVYHVLFQLVSHVVLCLCFLSLCAKIFPRPHMLGCTNAAKRPPHSRPTRRRASDAAACASVPHPVFFFRFPTRADSGRFAPTQAVSVRIGRNRRFRPKFKKKCETHRLTSHVSAQLLLLSSLCAPPAPRLHRLITDKFCF